MSGRQTKRIMRITSASVKQTKEIARGLAKYLTAGDVVALIGTVGSGKTIFVKGLASGLSCRRQKVTSPTFILMRQYRGRHEVYHFDLYRLKDIHQLEQIGYEEYFYGDGITVIEWADRIKKALPRQYLRIEFKIKDDRTRLLKFIPKGRHYADNLRKFQGKKDTVPQKYPSHSK